MATKTGTELVSAIKSHIGDRNNGKVGSTSVNDAVQDSINRALYDITRKHSFKELERAATISIVDSAYEYTMPTTDTDSNTISIKNILVATLQKAGETTVHRLVRINAQQRYRAYPDVSNTVTGYPSHYTEFGTKLNVFPYPDGSYTLTLYANTWPTLFAESTLGNAHPLGEYVNDLIENFAVADIFYKLEQIDDASLFMGKYEMGLTRTIGAIRTKPDHDIPTTISHQAANPAKQAFTGDYTGEI